jgi:hypothetical protein
MTTVSNPIDEVHPGLALALLQTQFEHKQFQDKKSRAYETEHGGKHEPHSSSKSSLLVLSCSVRHWADMLRYGGRSNQYLPHARGNSLQTSNESNQTMQAVINHHGIHDHHTTHPVLQSTSLNARLAALVCLAIHAKQGLWKDRLLENDVDEHEVMDRDGQPVHSPKCTSTQPYYPTKLY